MNNGTEPYVRLKTLSQMTASGPCGRACLSTDKTLSECQTPLETAAHHAVKKNMDKHTPPFCFVYYSSIPCWEKQYHLLRTGHNPCLFSWEGSQRYRTQQPLTSAFDGSDRVRLTRPDPTRPISTEYLLTRPVRSIRDLLTRTRLDSTH